MKLDENTLVIFFSDNGPFLSYGEHAGSAAPLREGKLTTFEGGVRVPCLMRWPGRVPSERQDISSGRPGRAPTIPGRLVAAAR